VSAVLRNLMIGLLSLLFAAMTSSQTFFPARRISATTDSMPRLSIVRTPLVLTLSVTQRRSDGNQNLRLCELTRHQRLVRMWECEIV
jgi:hypothetical protein